MSDREEIAFTVLEPSVPERRAVEDAVNGFSFGCVVLFEDDFLLLQSPNFGHGGRVSAGTGEIHGGTYAESPPAAL